MSEKTYKKSLFNKPSISTVAGAWVFYFLAAVLPILFLLVTAFAVFGVKLQSEIIDALPAEFKDAVTVAFSAAENASHGVTVFFIITVFFSGSQFLTQMKKDCEYIYGIKSENGGFVKRLSAVVAIGVTFAVFMCVAVFFNFENYLSAAIFGENRTATVTVLAFAAIIIVCFFINVMLNAFISPVKIGFIHATLGSIVSLSVTVAGTVAFIVYLRLFDPYNPFYGGLTTAIVALFWAYIIMFGLVLGVVTSKKAYFRTQAYRRL